jgi:hypothetical protein
MALVSQTYAGAFLNASELAPLGQKRTAIIHAAVEEVIGQERKPAIVLDLVAASGRPWPKRVVLNKGNASELADAYGDDTDHWVGRQIYIWSDKVMFQGRLVPGIKVSGGPAPTASAAPPPLDPTSLLTGPMVGGPGAPTMPPTRAPGGAALGGPDGDDEIPF